MVVTISMVVSVVLMVVFGKSILQTRAFKRLVLQDEQRSNEGFTSSQKALDLVGKIAIAKTVLRPSGKIDIEGKRYDAVALDGFIEVGESVVVEKHENYNLFVRKIETNA
jgi:membrane-bound serine protease (ClpP class)